MPKVKFGNDEVHVSELSGKLEDFFSISTSPVENRFCEARSKDPKSICIACYSRASINGFRKNLNLPLLNNSHILSGKLLNMEDIPKLKYTVMRFESHGDLMNVVHARNYIRIAKRNPHCNFTLWTKNHNFLDQAIRIEGKPNNLVCGISSPILNTPDRKSASKYDWCDFLFTVFDADFAIENKVEMNCPRKCKDCMKCYTPILFESKDSFIEINEILKSDSHKIEVSVA